jgi:hypothetical protein
MPQFSAMCRADDAREERATAAEKRYAERREILQAAKLLEVPVHVQNEVD